MEARLFWRRDSIGGETLLEARLFWRRGSFFSGGEPFGSWAFRGSRGSSFSLFPPKFFYVIGLFCLNYWPVFLWVPKAKGQRAFLLLLLLLLLLLPHFAPASPHPRRARRKRRRKEGERERAAAKERAEPYLRLRTRLAKRGSKNGASGERIGLWRLSLLALLLLPVVCSCASVVVRASPPPISFLSVPCCCIPRGSFHSPFLSSFFLHSFNPQNQHRHHRHHAASHEPQKK